MDAKKIPIGQHNIMTYSCGEGDNVLLLIHGGPGCPSNYLQDSHKHFSNYGYRVVTWDQLGCGASDKPNDSSLWQLSRFVEEVEVVRHSLNLGRINVLGQSWGGVLGLEYCFQFPQNSVSFIAADTAFDLPRMQRGFERKKLALGEETFTMMALREAEGTTEHPEYQAAVTLLMHRHMCRTEKWPEAVSFSLDNIAEPVFSQMFGSYFFNCTGNIKNYNRLEDLHKLQAPTLIVHGEHDYIISELAYMARDHLSNAELSIFRGCSHMPFYENPDQYTQTVLNFLNRHNFN